jgi:hypothetical protein
MEHGGVTALGWTRAHTAQQPATRSTVCLLRCLSRTARRPHTRARTHTHTRSCRAFKTVVFVIDGVDAFVQASKQTLLYNVLDALTSSQVQVCIRVCVCVCACVCGCSAGAGLVGRTCAPH